MLRPNHLNIVTKKWLKYKMWQGILVGRTLSFHFYSESRTYHRTLSCSLCICQARFTRIERAVSGPAIKVLLWPENGHVTWETRCCCAHVLRATGLWRKMVILSFFYRHLRIDNLLSLNHSRVIIVHLWLLSNNAAARSTQENLAHLDRQTNQSIRFKTAFQWKL